MTLNNGINASDPPEATREDVMPLPPEPPEEVVEECDPGEDPMSATRLDPDAPVPIFSARCPACDGGGCPDCAGRGRVDPFQAKMLDWEVDAVAEDRLRIKLDLAILGRLLDHPEVPWRSRQERDWWREQATTLDDVVAAWSEAFPEAAAPFIGAGWSLIAGDRS